VPIAVSCVAWSWRSSLTLMNARYLVRPSPNETPPDGTTTAVSPDGTKTLHSHPPPGKAA
jgi:hypothetical protein